MRRENGVALQVVAPAPPLLFVEVGVGPARKGRSKQSRAHVARVNRQRLLALASGGVVIDGQLTSKEATASALGAALCVGQVVRNNDRVDGEDGNTNNKKQKKQRASTTAGKEQQQKATTGVTDVRVPHVNSRQGVQPSPSTVPYTVSPIFGGIAINSFSIEKPSSSTQAAETASFCFNAVLDTWLDPKYKPAWVTAFFQHPLVFHCLSFSCGIMRDMTSNRPVQAERLVHCIKTIQLVNQQLDHLDHVDV